MILTDYLRRRRARNAYWDAGMAAGRTRGQLYTATGHETRADLLTDLGVQQGRQARAYPTAFSPQSSYTDYLEASSHLTYAVAATERQLAHSEPDHSDLDIWIGDAGAVEAAAWRELATVRDRAARADLLEQIYEHAARRHPRPAAEVLLFLSKTERELADAKAEGRTPAQPTDPLMPLRRTVAAVFILIGMFLALIILLGPTH